MTSQEILDIAIIAVVTIAAIAFILDLTSCVITCWKNTVKALEEKQEPEPIQSVQEIVESTQESQEPIKIATINWVEPVEVVEEVEPIDTIAIAKQRDVATFNQLCAMPTETLRAIAKSKNIKLGNRKKPEAIAKILGTVRMSEIPA